MVFNTGAALLDAIVLAGCAKEPEGAYGYKITQDVAADYYSFGIHLISGITKTAEGRMPDHLRSGMCRT